MVNVEGGRLAAGGMIYVVWIREREGWRYKVEVEV